MSGDGNEFDPARAEHYHKSLLLLSDAVSGWSGECQCIDPPNERDDGDERGTDQENPEHHSMYCPEFLEAAIDAGLSGKSLPG